MDDLFAPRTSPESHDLERSSQGSGELMGPGELKGSGELMGPGELMGSGEAMGSGEPMGSRRGGRVLGWVAGVLVAIAVGAGGFWLVNRGGDPGSKVVTQIPAGPSALPTGEAPRTVEASTAPAPTPAQP
jgi:hypothetical protein